MEEFSKKRKVAFSNNPISFTAYAFNGENTEPVIQISATCVRCKRTFKAGEAREVMEQARCGECLKAASELLFCIGDLQCAAVAGIRRCQNVRSLTSGALFLCCEHYDRFKADLEPAAITDDVMSEYIPDI